MNSFLNISEDDMIIEYVINRKAPNKAYEAMSQVFEDCVYRRLGYERAKELILKEFNNNKSGILGKNMIIEFDFITSYYNDVQIISLALKNTEIKICSFYQYGKPKEHKEEDKEDGKQD